MLQHDRKRPVSEFSRGVLLIKCKNADRFSDQLVWKLCAKTAQTRKKKEKIIKIVENFCYAHINR